jgi:hypothetical protein
MWDTILTVFNLHSPLAVLQLSTGYAAAMAPDTQNVAHDAAIRVAHDTVRV